MWKFVSIFLISLFCSPVFAANIDCDQFTVALDTVLSSHTTTGTVGSCTAAGNTYDDDAVGSPLTVEADTDDVRGATDGDRFARLIADVGDDDMDVSAEAKAPSNADREWGVTGRIPSTESGSANGYSFHLYSDGTAIDVELSKIVASVETSLGTYDMNGTPGTFYSLKLEIRTAAKKGYIDTVERISSTDDSLTGNNFAGVRGQRNSADGRIDDLLVESVTAVAGIKKGLVMLIGTFMPSAFADEKPPAQYESAVCGTGKSEMVDGVEVRNPRHPCIIEKYGIKNWALQGESGAKMYVNVFDPPEILDILRTEWKPDANWPKRIKDEIAVKGYSKINI